MAFLKAKSKEKMKIGVLYEDFSCWNGGYEFLLAYLKPLSIMPDCDAVVFVRKMPPPFLKMLAERILGRVKEADFQAYIKEKKPIDAIKHLAKVVPFWRYANLEKEISKCGIDLIFPAERDMSGITEVPYVPYIYDFQHKYFPSLFASEEIEERNKWFETQLSKAKAVIVEAKDVKSDIQKFYPQSKAKVFVMPYTAVPDAKWLRPCKIDVLKKYGLHKNYFLISNQFWIHKSHATAFRALAELQKEGIGDADIVCTGNTDDYRNPKYFESLKGLISELGISDCVHFLGLIPKLEQIAIMKKCIAVIQPTLFEGNPGGGAAYNAMSLDVPIILSDIKVNQELIFDKAVFFRAEDHIDLKNKMKEVMQNDFFRTRKSKKVLIANGKMRMEKLQQAIRAAITYATGGGL